LEEGRVRVIVWSESTEPRSVYPRGIHGELTGYLNGILGVTAQSSQLSDPDNGLSERALSKTDVLVWWGHAKHAEVPDEVARRVKRRVEEGGMGFVPLHSAHFSKPFIGLMGTKCGLGSWREDGRSEYVHVHDPSHPIARGIKDFVLPQEEMYGEPFDVPKPESVVFTSIFEADGAIFRSGLTWAVGRGRVFYFRPGHETHPTFMDANVRKAIGNAVFWAARRSP